MQDNKLNLLNKRLVKKGICSVIMLSTLFFDSLALACSSNVSTDKCKNIEQEQNCCQWTNSTMINNARPHSDCYLNCTWTSSGCTAATSPEVTCGL